MTEILDVAKKDGRWSECPACHEIIITAKLAQNLKVCPHCDFHFRLTARERIEFTCDSSELVFFDAKALAVDVPAVADDAIRGAMGTILGVPSVVGAMDFGYKGGSMGVILGQSVIALMRLACENERPLVLFCASGGVRVQEGIWGLLQMLRTVHVRTMTAVPLITVYTDPTYGGVTASFSALGDFILAEPGAKIGFTGPRIIESTTPIELPPDFQDAQRVFSHGFLDKVVPRHEMRETLAYILHWIGDAIAPYWSTREG